MSRVEYPYFEIGEQVVVFIEAQLQSGVIEVVFQKYVGEHVGQRLTLTPHAFKSLARRIPTILQFLSVAQERKLIFPDPLSLQKYAVRFFNAKDTGDKRIVFEVFPNSYPYNLDVHVDVNNAHVVFIQGDTQITCKRFRLSFEVFKYFGGKLLNYLNQGIKNWRGAIKGDPAWKFKLSKDVCCIGNTKNNMRIEMSPKAEESEFEYSDEYELDELIV